MSSKRYNIWLDTGLIEQIKAKASVSGLKVATFIRMCILENLNSDKETNERKKNQKS